MKAVVRDTYGSPDVLRVEQLEKPKPNESQILIKVYSTTVNRTDCGGLRGEPFVYRFFTGLLKPKHASTGTDFAGKVVAVGKNVTIFKKGDRVFGFNDDSIGSHREYLILDEKENIGKIPNKVSFQDAAASIEGFHYAYNFINKVSLRKGQKVMVNGATGGIGSAAVQLLKNIGLEITATCSSNHIELVKSLGAKKVIDYTKEDFTNCKTKFDFVFDAVGKSSFGKCKKIMKSKGVYISSELGKNCENIFYGIKGNFTKGKRVVFPLPTKIKKSLEFSSNLLRDGLYKPVIDRVYTLDKTAEAFEYVEKGEKIGNVLLKIN